MKRTFKYGLLLFSLLLVAIAGFAQKTGNVTATNDHLILLLDLRESNDALQTVLKNAGIIQVDPSTIKNKDYSSLQKLGWDAQLLPSGILHLEKAISNTATGLNVTVLPQKLGDGGYP